MTSYLLVANPVSGKGGGRRVAEVLRARLASATRVEVVETTHRGAGTLLAAERGRDFDRVVAIGGDGTLNEVLGGLMRIGGSAEERPELGYVPSGTANVATRAFGFSSTPERAARGLVEARSRPVDVGVVRRGREERPFLLWMGAGYDAVAIDTLNTSRTGFMGLSGLARMAPAVLGAFGRYAEPPIDVQIDGVGSEPAGTVILANVGVTAFGGFVARSADPFDGLLDVVAVPGGSKLRLAPLAVSMMTADLSEASGVRHERGTLVKLDSGGEVPVHVDGEPAGTLPVEVGLEVGAVRLVRPTGASRS